MSSSTTTPALDATPSLPVLQLFSLAGQTALVTGANRGKLGVAYTLWHHRYTSLGRLF